MKPIAEIVIDANVLLSILIGGPAARRIVMHPLVPAFYVTPDVRREVEEYIPVLAMRKKLDESLLRTLWSSLPLIETAVDRDSAAWNQAFDIMGKRDLDDVPTLAVALEHNWPVWSQDRDFEEARGICSVYTTAQLLHVLDSGAWSPPVDPSVL